MAKISLSELTKQAQQDYEDLEIDGIEGGPVTLLNPWRLPDEQRGEIFAFGSRMQVFNDLANKTEQELKELSGPGIVRELKDFFELAAGSKEESQRLLASLNYDLPTMMTIFLRYMGSMQSGEASGSVNS